MEELDTNEPCSASVTLERQFQEHPVHTNVLSKLIL